MKKAIFIDRDWTLNTDIWYAYKVDDCVLVEPWIWEMLHKFRAEWYLLVIITNQAWIDKWFYNEDDFNLFMKELERQLNVVFDWIYFCPFHPKFSWESECRKPNNWMLLNAQKDLDIDLDNSFMIWDNFKDVEAWRKSGCKTIMINTNNFDLEESDVKPDFLVNKWSGIEKIILG